jgi:hypothetical protein
MQALLCRFPGIRQIADQCGEVLGTSNFSSLSHALRRVSGVKFLRSLIGSLETTSQYRRNDLVALDSMALTIGKNRRHHCERYNNHAVGGGVLWAYQIRSNAGTCPVRLLKFMRGAWNDASLMIDVVLVPKIPVYLMDRGFYCIDRIREWLDQKVRFIVRVKAKNLVYDVIRDVSKPQRLRNRWFVKSDQIVRLGSPNRRTRNPHVRLIRAVSPSGEEFVFATSEEDWGCNRIVDSYKKRWHIERFHRFLKNNIGLAHIYSFDANGMEFMILTALLTAMLLFTTATGSGRLDTITRLFSLLNQIRSELGIPAPWRRNILAVKRNAGGRKRSPK